MKIKAIKTFDEGYMYERFVFGGTKEISDCKNNKYPYNVISYVIDISDEVILVDTSFPENISDLPANDKLGVYTGKRISTFKDALNDAGYSPSDVDKIIITHNHIDHTGELSMFPNAAIYMSDIEKETFVSSDNLSIVGINLDKGEYKNFIGAFEISKNIYMVNAYGHTLGHAMVLIYDEIEKTHYMLSGDAVSTNSALIHGELSVVNADMQKAMESQNNIKDFIKDNDTIYLASHDPISINNLLHKKIMEI